MVKILANNPAIRRLTVLIDSSDTYPPGSQLQTCNTSFQITWAYSSWWNQGVGVSRCSSERRDVSDVQYCLPMGMNTWMGWFDWFDLLRRRLDWIGYSWLYLTRIKILISRLMKYSDIQQRTAPSSQTICQDVGLLHDTFSISIPSSTHPHWPRSSSMAPSQHWFILGTYSEESPVLGFLAFKVQKRQLSHVPNSSPGSAYFLIYNMCIT